MLSLKVRDITKSVVVAIVATFLFVFIFLIWLLGILEDMAYFLMDKYWMKLYANKYAVIFIIHYVPEIVSLIVSGLLMGLFIGFVSKNNRIFTTIVALLLISIIFFIMLMGEIREIPSICDKRVEQIRLSLQWFLSLALFIGCTLLGVWFFARGKRKTGQQSLPSDNSKVVPQQ